jgi:RNA polymerase sigma factor (sigma-70 family)
MHEHDWLAGRFDTERPRLRAVAYRMLGSLDEADDAVQETWIRLSRSDNSPVENLSGWLTTIVARVSLNMLRSRKSHREDLMGTAEASEPRSADATADPEQEALLADSVGLALLVVLDTLTPAERLAFVLHDMFAVPFEEIAPIVDRSPAAARQLASRARRRVQQAGSGTGTEGAGPEGASAHDDGTDTAQAGKANLVRAFLAASREGDFEALLAMLDPDIVLRADQAVVQMGADAEVRGADAVTRVFAGRAWAPLPALIDGAPGLVWVQGGEPQVVFRFTIDDGKITAIDMQGELAGLDIALR